jgi:hypothetical protein
MTMSESNLMTLQPCQEISQDLLQQQTIPLHLKSCELLPFRLEDLPAGMLLLGLDDRSQPVLMDLFDPSLAPLLVTGDAGCGKTALLQSLAYTGSAMLDTQFGVLTSHPEEWREQECLPGCLGVWPAYHPSAGDFLKRLISWADVLAGTRQSILLLVDGLEINALEPPARHYLRWLLARGAASQILCALSVNASRLSRLGCLQMYFPTRLLGCVRMEHTRHLLSSDPELRLTDLVSKEQFYLCGQQGCIRFRLPFRKGR